MFQSVHPGEGSEVTAGYRTAAPDLVVRQCLAQGHLPTQKGSLDFSTLLQTSQKAHKCPIKPSHCLHNPTCLSRGHPSVSVTMYPALPLWVPGRAACASEAPVKQHRKSPEGLLRGRRKVEQGGTCCMWETG